MLDDFRPHDLPTGSGARIRARVGGSGPPVLLLHGWPQTSAMWHRIAPHLAATRTVVLADLPGYGDSTAAPGASLSKRAMAAELVEAMEALGHDRFAVVGHDRGARCAYRMALDHPQVVTALAVLDILPTADVFARVDATFALGAWHWFFLAQPDVPERLIAADPDAFFTGFLRPAGIFDPEAVAHYRAAWRRPEVVRAMGQDYRAGASIDVADDEHDRGTTIDCPTLALWGGGGPVGREPDPLAIWRAWAPKASGHQLDCGHYLAEEAPEDTLGHLTRFLSSRRGSPPR
ncbi:alpha/beta fold hydrolase [Saccharopolyspora mangrovi]|uniref:Alpha/beta hydrolase n=1 Tax=Saccharopolyspora mangrovi TaxID=3082379 RepID=A0ABU6AEH6_9PSEU|nr:alpha/beta hydrolase [Saccharopolyspora sp. S2-29]MEB3369957.1 alpha/beta hydrolase [Saccharopolyspora sp. S2-29]